MRIGSLLLVVWLLIGAFAAWQRDYFESENPPGCKKATTITLTVIAGPLNYLGVNPKVDECDVPEPSR